MLDVLIITHNEAANLPYCLNALEGWVHRVVIIDSGSTDATPDIARAHGAEFIHHPWEGYARQRNWALDHVSLPSPWTLILDADEVITPQLRQRILDVVRKDPADVSESGFFLNRLTYFLDRPIRHCGYFPSWNLRLFKRGRARYEDRAVHEHLILDGPTGYLPDPMLHHDRRGLEHYFAKHNRYSTLEARQLLLDILHPARRIEREATMTPETRRRRWLKRNMLPRVPLPGLWRFLYMYVLRLGFLDGKAGFEFCKFIGGYDAMVALKLRAMLDQARRDGVPQVVDNGRTVQGLAIAEGHPDLAATVAASTDAHASATHTAELPSLERSSSKRGAATALDSPDRHPGGPFPSGSAEPGVNGSTPMQLQPETSPWSFREKLGRALWMVLGKPLFRLSFHNWYAWRRLLLRLFGARVGDRVRIRPTVNVEIPWMLEIRDDATIGDHAILYSLGQITIGARAIVSQYAHLCAGTHDYTDHRFPLLRLPITLGNDSWVGADAFIGPGVTVGDLAVLGARSSAYRDLPPATVCVGNPARPIKQRLLL